MVLVTISTDSGIITDYMVPDSPFVWRYTTSFNLWAEWYNAFPSVGGVPSTRIIVSGVLVDNVTYTEKTSLNDCIADEESYYFDVGAQVFYCHICHDCVPSGVAMSVYKTAGFSDSDIYYDADDIEYQPLLTSQPMINKKADSLNYGKVALVNQKLKFANENGDFDEFITAPVPGGTASIYFFQSSGGNVLGDTDAFIIGDTDGYQIGTYENPPTQLYTGVISGDSFSETDFNLSVSDTRSGLKIQIPANEFTVTAYPTMPDSFSGQVIQDGYGVVKGIKATPITGTVLGSPVQFKYAETATTLTAVYVKKNDTWTEVTPTASTVATGLFTLAVADCVVDSSLLECKVDATLRGYYNPGTIIENMNLVFAGVPYDSSGYNQTKWSAEKAKLANIGICFDEKKDMLDWIEKIQNGTDSGFLYTTQGDGKRILLVDDIDKTEVLTIRKEDINSDISATRDFSDFASTVIVKYKKDYFSGRFNTVKNTDYKEYVRARYRYEQDKTYETYLTGSTPATTKAAYFASRIKDVRMIYTFDVSGIDYFSLELFDIVYAELDKETRPIFGTVRCQVLGIKYNFRDETISLTLKEI
jgi:hypothetical protein